MCVNIMPQIIVRVAVRKKLQSHLLGDISNFHNENTA